MFSDIGTLAYYAAHIRNSQGYETDRTTYGYGTGDKKHDAYKQQGLGSVRQLNLALKMSCKRTGR